MPGQDLQRITFYPSIALNLDDRFNIVNPLIRFINADKLWAVDRRDAVFGRAAR